MKKLPWWTWLVAVLVVALAVGVGVLIGRGGAPEEEPEEETSTVEPEEPAETPTVDVLVYFPRGETLGVVRRSVAADEPSPDAGVRQLLLGPTPAEEALGFTTTVPDGTELLDLTVADGTARVDLSGAFDDGGGTLSMSLRLAQLTYTLTYFDTVERVVLLIDGEEVAVFSGEGIILDHPMVREQFDDLLPAIFVEGPCPFDVVASPIEVMGSANTFEAAFDVRIEAADGTVLADVPQMASSGTGTRGSFDVQVPFTVSRRSDGALIVYEVSAKDGSEINLVRIPVTLTP